MRINRFLASCGICSRRKAEELVTAGEISINGVVITNLATEVSEKDKVVYNGKRITLPVNENVYIMLNKPMGCITTVSDEQSRPTVMQYVKEIKQRIYPVGRLDGNTKGLLLLTNDGDFAYKLTHPKNEIKKTYTVVYNSLLSLEEKKQLESGILLDGELTAQALLSAEKKQGNCYKINITIHEGRNRQVRRMFEAVGKKIKELTRIQIGKLYLGDLPQGKYKILTTEEINKIFM